MKRVMWNRKTGAKVMAAIMAASMLLSAAPALADEEDTEVQTEAVTEEAQTEEITEEASEEETEDAAEEETEDAAEEETDEETEEESEPEEAEAENAPEADSSENSAADYVSDGAVDMTTSYPGITLTAGDTTSFSLDFASLDGDAHDVKLTAVSLPEGWEGYFKGDSKEITKLHIAASNGMDASAGEGLATYSLTISGEEETGVFEVVLAAEDEDGGIDYLTLELNVSEVEAGESNFSSEYPEQQGASGSSFSFDTTLVNNRGTDQTYSLSAQAPDGWEVSFTPSDESTAVTSIAVESGSSQGLTVKVTPTETVEKGDYEIPLTAVSANDTLSTTLKVSITGTYSVDLSTSDGRLSFDAYANKDSSVTLTVTNEGNVDLTNLNLTSSAPTDWTVEFSESTIDTLEAGASKEITATVTPCEDVITGDYVTTITISNDEVTDSAEFRVSVKTSTTWGVAAICIILVLAVGLAFIFKKYGRR